MAKSWLVWDRPQGALLQALALQEHTAVGDGVRQGKSPTE